MGLVLNKTRFYLDFERFVFVIQQDESGFRSSEKAALAGLDQLVADQQFGRASHQGRRLQHSRDTRREQTRDGRQSGNGTRLQRFGPAFIGAKFGGRKYLFGYRHWQRDSRRRRGLFQLLYRENRSALPAKRIFFHRDEAVAHTGRNPVALRPNRQEQKDQEPTNHRRVRSQPKSSG